MATVGASATLPAAATATAATATAPAGGSAAEDVPFGRSPTAAFPRNGSPIRSWPPATTTGRPGCWFRHWPDGPTPLPDRMRWRPAGPPALMPWPTDCF
ncbi:hypothetical protein J3R03_001478 [Actinoplanes couchii]|nr:hypothetical protein [Actinoplanes couchii]